MAEAATPPNEKSRAAGQEELQASERESFSSFAEIRLIVLRNGRLFVGVVGILLAACLVYCFTAPKEYEAGGEVELRGSPESLIAPDRGETASSAAFAMGQVQLETLANVLRSEQIAWRVITEMKLYEDPAFARNFRGRFPAFNPNAPSAEAKEYLLRRFDRRLSVASLPHTVVLSIRFRSHDAGLSARVVNELISQYQLQERDARLQSAQGRKEWLNAQLEAMRRRVNEDVARLAEYQRANGILSVSADSGNAGQGVGQSGVLTAIEEGNRALVNAMADRVAREAEYRAMKVADPEVAMGGIGRSGAAANAQIILLQQLKTRRSDLELELARLEIEHGPNFPRVMEIRTEMRNADAQIKMTHAQLVESFRSAWESSVDREELLRKNLNEMTGAGMKLSGAALTYAAMRQEASANRETYLSLLQRTEEASVSAGSRGSAIRVIDFARPPAKPASPNIVLDLAVTGFVGIWLALTVVLGREGLSKKSLAGAALLLFGAVGAGTSYSQVPTPNTSGLPAGVARIPQSAEVKSTPTAKDAPEVWNTGRSAVDLAGSAAGPLQTAQVMAARIVPGDMLEVTEAHETELRSTVRVSEAGNVVLPLAGEVDVDGLDERSAAHAIEAALSARGMLLHPQVTVLVTSYAGQDVSVLGEVARPGVYSYAVHHRLLDLISAASGLSQYAGRVVTITHRSDPERTEVVVLDPAGTDPGGKHNPELRAGDTVQVGRAGLIYVVGDVVRPGGFPVDPVQAITVVQALSLAWGPAQNAALKKAVLIREQPGGRTVTALNLKRMLRGLDPDLPVRDRDILFVPDSMAKNLLNRSLESVIQSAAGVSIYSGLVYSQRY